MNLRIEVGDIICSGTQRVCLTGLVIETNYFMGSDCVVVLLLKSSINIQGIPFNYVPFNDEIIVHKEDIISVSKLTEEELLTHSNGRVRNWSIENFRRKQFLTTSYS